MADNGDRQKLIYCSGPSYSQEERDGLLKISSKLESSDFKTFVPFRDGIEYRALQLIKSSEVKAEESLQLLTVFTKAIFAMDIYQIVRRCDGLVFNMNGRTPEEGSVFKTSLAYSTGKPLVLYKNDNRSIFHGSDNTMITGLSDSFSTVKKLDRLPRALSESIKKARKNNWRAEKHIQHPPFIKQMLKLGEIIWNAFSETDFAEPMEKGTLSQILDFKIRCEKITGEIPIELWP